MMRDVKSDDIRSNRTQPNQYHVEPNRTNTIGRTQPNQSILINAISVTLFVTCNSTAEGFSSLTNFKLTSNCTICQKMKDVSHSHSCHDRNKSSPITVCSTKKIGNELNTITTVQHYFSYQHPPWYWRYNKKVQTSTKHQLENKNTIKFGESGVLILFNILEYWSWKKQ